MIIEYCPVTNEWRNFQMKTQVSRLINMIEKRGWKGRIIPVAHLADLRDSIYDLYKQELVDEVFFRDRLGFFSFNPQEDFPDARSILIIAVPTPQMRIIFHWHNRPVPVIIPPTYISYTPRTENTRAVIGAWLQQEGYRLGNTKLPLKTLAVYSGLAEYGRNNICYVSGMGSFLQLVGAFSDLPCDNGYWSMPKMLDRCKSCTACLKCCPTKAIVKDRFLLHAELCLTYHNEAASDFPYWINPSWHHCLIGCMRCQTACPENRVVFKWFEDRGEFSEKETTLFVQRVPFDQLPAETITKMKSLEINEDYKLLCRNLSMIIAQEDCKK